MKLRILLIEDSPADATQFKREIARINPDAEVIVAKDVSSAFHALEGDAGFDRVCISPNLGETLGFDRLIKDVRRHDIPVEILTSDRTSPAFLQYLDRLAKTDDEVNLLGKNNPDELRNLIERILKDKSGGNTTLRVEQAKQEVRLLNLEEHIKEARNTLTEQLKIFQQMSGTVSEFSIRLSLSTQAVEQLKQEVRQLRSELQDVSDVAEAAAEKVGGEDSDHTKIWLAWIAAGAAVITGLGIPLIERIMPRRGDSDRPAQVPPSPNQPLKKGGEK